MATRPRALRRALSMMLMLTAIALLGGVACGDLTEFYEVSGRYPCSSSDDCLGGFACGALPDDPDRTVCQPACRDHADCAGGETPAVCTSTGACVEILAELCTTLEGNFEADGSLANDTILLGAMTPQAAYGDRELASVLAVREINEAGGIAGGRQLALIGCDDGGDPTLAVQVANHLAALDVPAVIGPYFSSVVIETAQEVFVGQDILVISPSATSPLITGLEDNGLVWRTISSDEAQAAAMAELVLQESPSQVLFLHKNEAYGNSIQDVAGTRLLSALSVDGYRPLPYEPVSPDPTAIALQALNETSAPDVIALAGTAEVVEIIDALETVIASEGLTPPMYVLSEGGRVQGLLDLAERRPDLAPRLRGTDPSLTNGDVTTGFNARFLSAFQKPPQTFAANAYDAVYVVAHALSTTSGSHPGGQVLAAGIERLLGGATVVTTNPAELGVARDALAAGNTIDLEGASGPLDFDATTGNTSGGVTGWIVELRTASDARFASSGAFVGGQWVFEPSP